ERVSGRRGFGLCRGGSAAGADRRRRLCGTLVCPRTVDHLDLLGQPQVRLCDPARIVRRQHDRNFGVANVDVGVVIHVVGDARQAVDEADAVRESVEGKCLRQRAAAPRPTGKPPERTLNLEIGEFLLHIASRLRVDRRWRYYTAPALRAIAVTASLLAVAVPCRAESASDTDSIAIKTTSRTAYWTRFTAGAISSILLHEAGHIATSYAVGGHPSFGFDDFRPTIYSGIDSHIEPHKQF